MVYFQGFVSAMVATALVVVTARFLLSFLLSEPEDYTPSLCVGAVFLLGHYSVSGSIVDPDTVVAITKICGSAVCLVILRAGFRYRAIRMNVA
jgi:hypothetical protein